MTVTFSVTRTGSMFHGVTVKTSTTEVATARIARNFSCGVFVCVVYCISPQFIYVFKQYNIEANFNYSANCSYEYKKC